MTLFNIIVHLISILMGQNLFSKESIVITKKRRDDSNDIIILVNISLQHFTTSFVIGTQYYFISFELRSTW
jgi:hypothetical protein